MHDFMPSGAAIPRTAAMISMIAAIFVPGEIRARVSDVMQTRNMRADEIKWKARVLWLWHCHSEVYVYCRGNITHWTVSCCPGCICCVISLYSTQRSSLVWNVNLRHHEYLPNTEGARVVVLTWNECTVCYLSCFIPNVTCSVEQMTSRFSPASDEA